MNKGKKMKSVLALLMCVLMAMAFLAGCTAKTAEPSADASATQETKQSVEQTQDAQEEKKPEETSGAGSQEWDPSEVTDVVQYTDLEKEYGPLPADFKTEGMVVGAVFPEASNEYWTTVAKGIESKCAEYGMTADIQFALTTEDQAGQLSAAETLAKKDLDAYVFSPMTADLLTNLTEELKAKGKPVLNAYFTPMENADVFVGAIDNEIAKMAAQKTIDELGGKGKVATVMGAVASKVNQVRCGTYKDYIEANSDIEVVAELPAEWVPETAMQMTQDLLTVTPDVDLFWCANDNLALGVIEGIRSRDSLGKIKVLSMDATEAALKAIKAGEMFGSYSSDPFKVGELSVEAAVRMLAGQKVARVVAGPAELVDSSNIDQFLKE